MKLKDKEYKVIIDDDTNTRYQCRRCEKKCNTRDQILLHHYYVHREMKFKCEKCDKLFPFKSFLKKHVGKCEGIVKEKRQQQQALKNIEYKIISDESSQKYFSA